MGAIASQVTSLMIVYSSVYSDADQRKHQSSASLALGPVNSQHKWPVTRKMFPFDDVIMRTNKMVSVCETKGPLYLTYYRLDISRYNITRYCTQHNKFDGKTSVRLRTHGRYPYLSLTGEQWESSVSYLGNRYRERTVYSFYKGILTYVTDWSPSTLAVSSGVKNVVYVYDLAAVGHHLAQCFAPMTTYRSCFNDIASYVSGMMNTKPLITNRMNELMLNVK